MLVHGSTFSVKLKNGTVDQFLEDMEENPELPPLVLRHIFADEADLRAAGILLRGDQPPL